MTSPFDPAFIALCHLSLLASSNNCFGLCLPFVGGAAVLSGSAEQSRVPKAVGDVRLEPGGGQHADVGQLWIHNKTEVRYSVALSRCFVYDLAPKLWPQVNFVTSVKL